MECKTERDENTVRINRRSVRLFREPEYPASHLL